jgi:hypothetical protein
MKIETTKMNKIKANGGIVNDFAKVIKFLYAVWRIDPLEKPSKTHTNSRQLETVTLLYFPPINSMNRGSNQTEFNGANAIIDKHIFLLI